MSWTRWAKFLKSWGTLILAVLAFGSSMFALYLDNRHYDESLALQRRNDQELKRQYEELTKPHTEHEEVLDKLSRLDTRIESASKWVAWWEDTGHNAASLHKNLSEAEQLSAQAEEAWRSKNYGKAESLIDEAYQSLDRIPRPPGPVTASTVENVVDAQGVFTQAVSVTSADGQLQIRIEKGITGKDKNGNPLTYIIITRTEPSVAPPVPQYHFFVGRTFDLGPDGAIFEPPITLTFTYDPSSIPSGADEEDLAVAYWDTKENKWRLVESFVDPVTNTISAKVNHFTLFSVLARLQPYPPPVNWVLIGVITVASILVVGVVVWFLAFRRKYDNRPQTE